ncbi:MAG: hypothetical protein WBH19_06530 [Candidatus Nanopelagicales bacterium]|jgi:hypothetical protein|tara:strand:+ start:1001 stop:1225 length:225 start_codon:yes stop_codon:yes gene_type:complete
MDIRKISIGPDYKSSAMHYLVGQEVLGGNYFIHLIQRDTSENTIKVWIQQKDEILLWKEFNAVMPISIEYNIHF